MSVSTGVATPPSSSFSRASPFQEPAIKIVTPSSTLPISDLVREIRASRLPRLPSFYYLCGGGVVHITSNQTNGLGDKAVERLGQCMLSCKSVQVLLDDCDTRIAVSDNAGIVRCFSVISGLLGLADDDEMYNEFVGPEEIKAFKKVMRDRIFVTVEKSYACYSFDRSKEAELETSILKAIAPSPTGR